MVNTVFSGLSFFLEGFPLKVKHQLSEEIKKGGGSASYLLTKKTSVCVVPNLDDSKSYNLDQCTKAGIPVATDAFIFDSISSGRLRLDAVHANKNVLLKTISELKAKTTSNANTNTSSPTRKAPTLPSTPKSTPTPTATSIPKSTAKSTPATSTNPTSSSKSANQPTSSSLKSNAKSTSTTPSTSSKPTFSSTFTFGLKKTDTTTSNGMGNSTTSGNGVTNSNSSNLASSEKLGKEPRIFKSSYFKEPGKYSKSNSTPVTPVNIPPPNEEEDLNLFGDLPQATGYESEEHEEEDLFSLFDDVVPPSKPTTNSQSINKAVSSKPAEISYNDEDDEFAFSLFDSPPTTPAPTFAIQGDDGGDIESIGLPYPFFETQLSIGTDKPEKPRKDAYLCKLKTLSTYTPTTDCEGNTLISVTAMECYNQFSFEELRMLQSVRGNTKEVNVSIPELIPGGDMWLWGWPKFGQLGRGGKYCSRSAVPTHTPLQDDYLAGRVKQIACGWGHSVCLTESGDVASWGKGRGRLGHPEQCSKRYPMIIDALVNVTIASVACGASHTAFISDKGQLWTVGGASSGQLGHGNFDTMLVPKVVESLIWNPIAMVSCGSANTAAITHTGHLYTWGSNNSGQLGYKIDDECNPTPTLVTSLKNEVICHVAVGEKHMAATSANGCVWTWGCNDYMQLGHDGWHCATPRRLAWSFGKNRLGKAFMVACGESHTVAVLIKSKGEPETQVLTWGRGNLGALGNGSFPISSMSPNKITALDGHEVTQVSCGLHHTAALTSKGQLWIWGDNSRDQGALGKEISPIPRVVEQLSHVTQVSCGGYHTSVLVSGYVSRIIQHARDGNYQQVKDLLAVDPLLSNCIDSSTGYTPLHWACRNSHYEIVDLLLRSGADVNDSTPGVTALHVCATQHKSALCLEILIRAPTSANGETPLHRAVSAQNENAVVILVQAGSDKRAVDSQGNTALHLAVSGRSDRIARYLVRNAAPITIHDALGKTPLHYCSNDSINKELKQIAQNHDVFISYAHSDMAFARKVRVELERNCIKCWMDDQRLEAGSDWRADIGKGILAARLIVFLGSPTSIVSDWCLKELRMGEKNSKLIWPVWYQKVEVPTAVSVLFSTSKFIDLSTDELYHSGIPTLVHKLKTTLGKMDRYEILDTHSPLKKMDFQAIASKPFSYMAYLPSDDFIATTLKHLLGSHGVLCVDEAMLPVIEDEPETSDTEEVPSVDVNVGFWAEEKKKEESLHGEVIEEVEAEGNEGINLCGVFLLVVSKELVDSKDNQLRKCIKFAQENHKPIVLIIKDLPQQFRFSADDKYFGSLCKCPSFQFATRELQFLSSEDVLENLKRVVYVVELLYKESLLAAKLRQIDLEKARMLAEAQRLADEEAKKRKKYSRV